MVPIPQSMRDTFKMEFMPDGYPGKRTEEGLVAHPMYGAYLLKFYVSRYNDTGDKKFLDSAIAVAEVSLKKMEKLGEAKVFYFTPNMRLTSYKGKFYSGLVQARWLQAFSQLAKHEPEYKATAAQMFEGLLIPVERGGVLKTVAGGQTIEEWPNEVPTYTLNGWTSILEIVHDYAQETGSKRAYELFNENIAALEKLLPLYDVPSVANSRYQLAGFVRFKVAGHVKGGTVHIPGEGDFPILMKKGGVWENHVRSSGRETILNVVMNRVSYPKRNEITLQVDKPVDVYIANGEYTPMATSLGKEQWVHLGKVSGRLSVPWEKAELVAYPTNFLKKYAGENYNVYHHMHVSNLRELHRKTGKPIFLQYANKWDAYTKRWPSMSVYANEDIKLTPIPGS